MLTDEQRQERDPAAIQMEIMALDKALIEHQPDLEAKHKTYQVAKAEYEVEKMGVKLIKERRSGLQSVLKSVSMV